MPNVYASEAECDKTLGILKRLVARMHEVVQLMGGPPTYLLRVDGRSSPSTRAEARISPPPSPSTMASIPKLVPRRPHPRAVMTTSKTPAMHRGAYPV